MSKMENIDKKFMEKVVTDEERIALAAKLDKELDDFINGLEKRQYTEGWPEDRWEEEMEKHPFFMTKPPEPGDELHPLLQGIQQLKYDPEENTAEELANNYKEDGNFNFKHKKYRLAIYSYTEGIKQKHNNSELKAILYNNRAASHFFLENFRSCLRDCEIALRFKPNYLKTIIRAANCCFEIKQYDKCIQFCDMILTTVSATNATVQALRQKAVNAEKEFERSARKKKREETLKKTVGDALLHEIRSRGIKILGCLKPVAPQLLIGGAVHLDSETGQLIWPVVFVYPQYGAFDLIRCFPEEDNFYTHLEEVFRDRAEWDKNHQYKVNTINLYFEQYQDKDDMSPSSAHLYQISLKSTLSSVLKRSEYIVRHGTPRFLVHLSDTAAEKQFLEKYHKVSLVK